jgi:hypothetical protein
MTASEPLAETGAGAFPLRRFAAIRISRAVEDVVRVAGGTGLVEGVHRTAANIRWGDQLLTVAHASVGGLPNGVTVEPPVALDQIGLAPGMGVQGDGIALRVSGASVVIFLSGAASWSPALPSMHATPTSRAERAQRALRLAATQAPRVGLGPLLVGIADGGAGVGALGRTAARSLADVLRALEDGASDRAVTAALPLIGLGPGATPSGDDLLVGLAAGLAATEHPLARAFGAGVAIAAPGLTNSVAECYLRHAGQLEFSERVHDAAAAILTGPDAGLERAVTIALAWGASSGADLLVGLLVGIHAASPELSPELMSRLHACADERNVAA